MRSASGYVHQDDVLPGTSTVWEFLSFHAALRLPEGHPPAAAAARLRLLLRQLSLAKVAASWPRCMRTSGSRTTRSKLVEAGKLDSEFAAREIAQQIILVKS